jgi:hypothetical protein
VGHGRVQTHLLQAPARLGSRHSASRRRRSPAAPSTSLDPPVAPSQGHALCSSLRWTGQRGNPLAKEKAMPEKRTLERARRARRKGKRPTTQAGAFVREEIEHVREGRHGARSTKQAIAIGLSKARRAGIKLGPPPKDRAKGETRRSARYARRRVPGRRPPSPTRSRATSRTLRRERRGVASRSALARQARQAARRRSPAAPRRAARRAVATKGRAGRKAAPR